LLAGLVVPVLAAVAVALVGCSRMLVAPHLLFPLGLRRSLSALAALCLATSPAREAPGGTRLSVLRLRRLGAAQEALLTEGMVVPVVAVAATQVWPSEAPGCRVRAMTVVGAVGFLVLVVPVAAVVQEARELQGRRLRAATAGLASRRPSQGHRWDTQAAVVAVAEVLALPAVLRLTAAAQEETTGRRR
jgi:hypothetical protein